MNSFTVTSATPTRTLANSIAECIRKDGRLQLRGSGAAAVYVMINAVIAAKSLLEQNDIFIKFTPDLVNLEVGKQEEKELSLTIFAYQYWNETERELEEIARIYDEREELAVDRINLQRKLDVHHADSPTLSGGDVDAAWDQADVGSETVGGSAPTPDQDIVDELGEAVGLTYEDDEPLHSGEKLAERDRHRWELDPASAVDED